MIKEVAHPAPAGKGPAQQSPSQEIDNIVRQAGGWKGEMLGRLRAVILGADPAAVEEVKWKKPSNPLGVPVWSHDGILCVADTLKNAVRLTFPNGAQMQDPKRLFNTRLDSKTVRAIDFRAGETVDEGALGALVRAAAKLNITKRRNKS